jgi:DNA-binding NarL/FixJ family response regulator
VADSERDKAFDRDLEARARLANDPIAEIVMRRDGDPAASPRYPLHEETTRLTAREQEILAYFSRGLERGMVADALNVGVETVKAASKSARTKLRAKNTTEACCEAIRQGLIR